MNRMLEPRPSNPPSRAWQALLTFGAVFAVVVLVMVWFRAESTSDIRDFWENAVHFRETGTVATELGVHNYLPFFTIFMMPWGLLPLRVAAVAFVALSLGLFGLTAYIVERMMAEPLGPRPRRALLLALGLALPYVYACAVVGNVGLLLLFLVVAAWYLVEREQEWAAGAALGLAALIKLLPALLIVFFLLRGRWRVVAGSAAVMIVLGLGLPLAALGPTETLRLHRVFYEEAMQGHSAYQTITSEHPRKAHYNNKALPLVVRRLLSPINASGDADERFYVNITTMPRAAILMAYAGLLAALVITSLGIVLLAPQPWPPTNADQLRSVRAQFGAWCALMLLASPLVWTHYLVLAYWPLALLADRAERTARARGVPCRLSMGVLLLWLVGAVLLAWPVARAAGAQIFGVLAVWIGVVVMATRRSP